MGKITRRELLLSLPPLVLTRRLLGTAKRSPIPLRGIHQVTLAVSDVQRSLRFYQSLFGMPVQARQGATVLLRLGPGPQYLALRPAGSDGPRIEHWGLAVQDFDVPRLVAALPEHGLSPVSEESPSGPLQLRTSNRGGTTELAMTDPDGLLVRLHHPADCGGAGPLGSQCAAPEPAPSAAELTLEGLSHLTINVRDPDATNAFYQRVFGLDIQAHQAASPLLGVGSGVEFLMFIGAGAGAARIDHVCFNLRAFDVQRIQAALERQGIQPRGAGGGTPGPMLHWVTQRMPNRGGAPEGTPELYFSDPDGLRIQLQDIVYCGGGGYLGDVC
jgi:catechol 2,3-dioxygenase-like lactoylglutathione lyase family enzyme